MSPLLFAVVDAVFDARMYGAILNQDEPQDMWGHNTWLCALDLGWWRSTW